MKRVSASVVIPIYNGAKRIRRTLQSVIAQGDCVKEVICVDDASTDATADTVEVISQTMPKLRLLRMDKNVGPLAARLEGVKVATGDYIVFADCGDRLLRDSLRGIIALAAATESDITAGATRLRVGPFTRLYHSPRSAMGDEYPASNASDVASVRNAYLAIISGKLWTTMWAYVYNREFLLAELPKAISARVGEDFYFNASVFSRACSIQLTDHQFYEWRYSGMGGKYYIDGYEDMLSAYGAIYDMLGDDVEAKRIFSLNLLDRLREAVTERILRLHRKEDVIRFADESLSQPLFRESLADVVEYCGESKECINGETMYRLAEIHLRRHKKFYIFTRIISPFVK